MAKFTSEVALAKWRTQLQGLGPALLIFIPIVLIGFVICRYLFFYAGGLQGEGRTVPIEGSARLVHNETTDAETIQVSIDVLKSIGWWTDDSKVGSLSRSADCDQVEVSPTNAWLYFGRLEPVTALTSIAYVAFVELDYLQGMANYTVFSSGLQNQTSLNSFDLSHALIDSAQALSIAETAGGKAFRERIDNECGVSISFSEQEALWNINYINLDSHKRLFCLRISSASGEIVARFGGTAAGC